jgi:large subunit ribosomal protein L15e
MGIYKYVKKLWKVPQGDLYDLYRERLIKWRKEPVTVRLERPTRIDRARSLGYKAKPGFIVVRQRVSAGGRQRAQIKKGRRSKNRRRKKIVSKSYQTVAEERANKKFKNCEVLNSYWVAKDAKNYWFEIILVDKAHPAIKKDPKMKWISKEKGRVYRGKTSSAKKSRGLLNKGKGAEKIRPSQRANKRRAH